MKSFPQSVSTEVFESGGNVQGVVVCSVCGTRINCQRKWGTGVVECQIVNGYLRAIVASQGNCTESTWVNSLAESDRQVVGDPDAGVVIRMCVDDKRRLGIVDMIERLDLGGV